MIRLGLHEPDSSGKTNYWAFVFLCHHESGAIGMHFNLIYISRVSRIIIQSDHQYHTILGLKLKLESRLAIPGLI